MQLLLIMYVLLVKQDVKIVLKLHQSQIQYVIIANHHIFCIQIIVFLSVHQI